MNAQQHYAAAERILAASLEAEINEYYTWAAVAADIAQAQVHATLALAAATGCVGNEAERRAWLDVTE